MNRTLKYSISALVVIFVIFFFNIHKNSNRITQSFLDSALIQKIDKLNTELNREIIYIKHSTFTNYDNLMLLIKSIKEHLDILKRQNPDLYDCKYMEDVKTMFEQKFTMIDVVRRENSILKNSMQFMPHIVQKIYKNIDSKEILLVIEALRFELKYFIQSQDRAFLSKIEQMLSILESNDKNLNSHFKSFKLHYQNILKNMPIQAKNIKKLQSINIENSLNRVLTLIKEGRDLMIDKNKKFELLSLTFVILMSLVIFIISRKEEKYHKSYIASLKKDSLTDDFNRASFIKDIENIKDIERYMILSFDINKFKFINDRYGASKADELLIYLSTALAELFSYKIYRVSSNLFNIIIPQSAKLHNVKSDIKTIVNSADIDFDLSISLYHLNRRDNYSTIHNNIQATLYSAKLQKSNKIVTYSESDKNILYYENLSKNSTIERNNLVKAIEQRRFIIFFQPIYDIKSKVTFKYEVLARLKEGDKILPPFKFIQIAEEFNLIGEITRLIIDQAFLKASQNPKVEFAINLSGKDLEDDSLIDYINEKSKELKVINSNITLEITETEAISDLKESLDFINKLKKSGFKFAIDDFGVGESSLRYLKELPVDYIKIDGSFIKNLENSKSDREFVKLINEVIKLYGKKSTAEFVENQAILDILEELNIDFAQGYFIGKPDSELLA